MKSFLSVFVVVVAATLRIGVCSRFSEDPRDLPYRLPTTVTPMKYTLQLEPNLDTNIVNGTVVIRLLTTSDESTTESMNYITLHLGEDSSIDESTVSLKTVKGSKAINNVSVRYYDNDAMVQIVLPQSVNLDFNTKYVLTMDFTSPLYNDPKGLFVGNYTDSSKYVASNFRATYARNVFPCFDEPQFQVPLILSFVRDMSYSVAFTTAVKSSKSSGDKMIDTFMPTSKVSLSSLGLFMSQMTPVTSPMGVTLYAPTGYSDTVDYLNTLITNIKTTVGDFPVPINLVVLPDRLYTSFSSLGFVFTTTEVYYGKVGAQLQWMSLRRQLAEAFLQQYFAFTKTPMWWSDLWLSDSISAYLAIEMLPQPTLDGLQITEIRRNGLYHEYGQYFTGPVVNDQLLARQDIESAIANQTIKNKGLSILTMWRDTLGKGVLDKTIHDFYAAAQTTTSTDLFLTSLIANIQSYKSYDATKAILQIPFWLNSTGNPTVTVSARGPTTATIVQSSDSSNGVLWPISISSTTGTAQHWFNIRESNWLIEQDMTIKAKQNTWVLLNLENAPYRVNYDATSYGQILDALAASNSSSIPAWKRSSIQGDAMFMAITGSLDFPTALMVMNHTQHDQVDWVDVVEAFDTITSLIAGGEWGLLEFGMYAETLFSTELLMALDLQNSTMNPDQWFARSLLTPWLCLFDIGTCRTAIAVLGNEVLSNGNVDSVDANDLDNVACLGARYLATPVDTILANYASADNLADKRLYQLALGCVIDPDSVQKVLTAMTSSPPEFSPAEMRDVMVGLASSVENSKALVSFLLSEAETIQPMIGSLYLSDVVKVLGKFKVDLTQLEALQDSDVDEYVVQAAFAASAKANSSFAWWNQYGQSMLSALPQLPVSTTTTSSTPTTTKATTTVASTTIASTTIASTTIASTTNANIPLSSTTTASSSATSLADTNLFYIALVPILTVLKGIW